MMCVFQGVFVSVLAFVVYDLGLAHVVLETEIVVHSTGEYLHTDVVP